jgi:hypothetical protein
MLPEGNQIAESVYEAKKIICPLGIEVEKIHACKNNCVLFRGDYADLDKCPKCGYDRYKRKKVLYGPPWAHYLGGYRDRLLGGPLGLPDLRCMAPDGVKHKDYRGEVLG